MRNKRFKVKIRHIALTFLVISCLLCASYYTNKLVIFQALNHFKIQNIQTNNQSAQADFESEFFGKNLLLLSFKSIQNSSRRILNDKYSNITLKKILPSTLQIYTVENIPVVYKKSEMKGSKKILFFDSWGNRTYNATLDRCNKNKCENANKENFDKNLILLEGHGAEDHFVKLFDFISEIPEIRCYKMEFIDERRWNMHIQNDIIVKLSEENYKNSVLFLQKLINKVNLVNEAHIIDLRFYPEKIFVTKKKNEKN